MRVWFDIISWSCIVTVKKKCTASCANTTVPTFTFIHASTSVTRGSTFFWLHQFFHFLSTPSYQDVVESIQERQMMSIISYGRSQFPIAFLIKVWIETGVWETVDVICSRWEVVSMWLFFPENDGVVHKQLCHYWEQVLGRPSCDHNDFRCFLLNDYGNRFCD